MSDMLTKVVQSLVPSPSECRAAAEELRQANPAASDSELVERAISTSRRRCGAAGLASGAFGCPLTAAPAALAETAWVLRQHAMLAGTLAALADPASTHDREGFEADVLAVVFPSAATQAVGELVKRAGRTCTRHVIRATIRRDVLRSIVRFAAKYLGVRVTQRAIISKAVPVVGGLIGGTWNHVEAGLVGRRALGYLRGQDIASC